MLDGIIAIDFEGNVKFNTAAERTFGFTREEVLGKPMAELIIPAQLRDANHRGFAQYLATGEGLILGKRLELTAIRADGTEFPVESAITSIGSRATPMFTGHLRDITERKNQEKKIARLTRIHELLNAISSAIVRIRDRQQLFDEPCCIAAEQGQFGIAWICLLQPDSTMIRPVAWSGLGGDELRNFHSTRSGVLEGPRINSQRE